MQDQLLAAVMATVKTSAGIAAEDVDFHRASNSEFGPFLDDSSERILAITNRLLASATCGSDISVPELKEPDDVESHWTKIVEVIDGLLEKAVCVRYFSMRVPRILIVLFVFRTPAWTNILALLKKGIPCHFWASKRL